MAEKCVFGVIIGNRGFFPDELARAAWQEVQDVLKAAGHEVVIPSPQDTKMGTVETIADARSCARLFREQRGRLDGIIIFLPNFGDEKAAADTVRWAEANVPVLVQAYPDEPGSMAMGQRRDSFCGKISVCNNLRQYGVEFTLTDQHTVAPTDPAFGDDLARFAATCRVVRGLRGARFGAIGARPLAFNTVRYSEKLLEASGISVEVVDLSEIIEAARKAEGSEAAARKLKEVTGYCDTSGVDPEGLKRIAALSCAIDDFIAAHELVGAAFQCWTAIEEIYGIVPCACMSMLSEKLVPQACEVDVTGAIAMYALQLASGTPSALVDWNNNWGDDPDSCIIFHCSNLAKSFFRRLKMDFHEIIAEAVGKEKSWGTCVGVLRPGPMTFARLSTDDTLGEICAYVGQGEIDEEDPESFGGVGVLTVPGLQDLLHFICDQGFEHHVAINRSEVAAAVAEAWEKYLGWRVYLHND
jgi:L-fucose isomerase-like protein